MVNVLSLPDDLLGRLAYPEGWHDFQWWITLRLGFQAPEIGLTGPVERGLIELNSNEWSVQVPRSRVLLDTRLIHDSWRKGCPR